MSGGRIHPLGGIASAVPLRFRVIFEGEVIGMSEKEIELMVQEQIAMSCKLGALLKGMAIQYGVVKIPGVNA